MSFLNLHLCLELHICFALERFLILGRAFSSVGVAFYFAKFVFLGWDTLSILKGGGHLALENRSYLGYWIDSNFYTLIVYRLPVICM